MTKKEKALVNTWDEHAKKVSYVMPAREDLLKSKDFIYRWLLDLNNNKKKRLLDAGCGIGQYVSGTRILGFKSEGVDISPEAVHIGRLRGEKITLGDLRQLPYSNEEFDIVIAGGSMEHFPETEKALREANRVLKKGGDFLLNVPYRYTLYVIGKKIQQILGIWESGYEKSFSIGKMKRLLEQAGFKVLEVKKTQILQGKRFPKLSKLLAEIDEVCIRLGFGGHHIWFKCVKR